MAARWRAVFTDTFASVVAVMAVAFIGIPTLACNRFTAHAVGPSSTPNLHPDEARQRQHEQRAANVASIHQVTASGLAAIGSGMNSPQMVRLFPPCTNNTGRVLLGPTVNMAAANAFLTHQQSMAYINPLPATVLN